MNRLNVGLLLTTVRSLKQSHRTTKVLHMQRL